MKLYSDEYEQCVLGSMLLDNSCIDLVQSILKKDHFFLAGYAKIYESICTIYNKDKACDLVMLSGQTEGIRPDLIASLTDKVSSSANAEFYAKQIKNFYLARMMKQMFEENSSDISNINVNEKMIKIDETLTSMMTNATTHEIETAQSMTQAFVEELKKGMQFNGQFLGQDCGYDSINGILDGIPFGELSIIAARPSIGKTALAVNMLTNIAMEKVPVCMFSLEMSNMELMRRMVSSETGISSYMMLHGMAMKSMDNCTKVNNALGKIFDTKISFFDSNNCSNDLTSIVSQIRSLSKSGTKVFFIDHIGLVRHPNNTMKRYEQVGDITMTLHKLAQNLKVAIVALCQLKRESEGKTPTLADLRESGDIEQNSDVCMFLHRDRAQGDEIQIPTDLIIIKNRNGKCGTAKLMFLPRFTKFVDAPKDAIYIEENKQKEISA